ncbi:MAG: hypothetical protein JW995_13275 [Melioribacteraceae bacterium]|nr:hypothetical protein [Melioribacteraceae bacterium]
MLDGYDATIIQSMHGLNENEIYGVGFADKYDGSGFTRVIMKYNGVDWRFIDIPELEEYFAMVVADEKTRDVLIVGYWLTIPGDPRHVYSLQNDTLKEIYSGPARASLGSMNGRTYVVLDQKIFYYKQNGLELFKDFTGTEYGGRIWGRSETDFFTVNDGWNFGHYNGKDLINSYKLNATIGQAVVFESEVFAFGTDINMPRDFILRGKLKNK